MNDVPLPDCIKWLARYKPTPEQRPFVANLREQLKRYEGAGNKPALGANILKSIDRLLRAT